MAAVARFFYESLTLNSAGTFFTDRKPGGGRCAEVTVIRGSAVFHTECLRFCFLGTFQDEQTKFMTFWNHYRIRKVKNSESPCGIPDYLYYNSDPDNNLSTDYKITVDMTDITAKSFTKSPNTFGCSEEFSELAMIIIQRQNLSMPKTVSEAEILYITIINEISSI